MSSVSNDSGGFIRSSSESSFSYDSDGSGYDGYHENNEMTAVESRSLYNQEPVDCPICCERVEEGCALILSCNHCFCTTCFLAYLQTRIGDGYADSITCPHIISETGQCSSVVSEDVLKEIMDEASYNKLRDMKNNAFVRKNVDYHHCPTPDCTNIVLCKTVNIDVGHDAAAQMNLGGDASAYVPRICDCFKCGRTSCLSCGASPFHTDLTCQEHQENEKAVQLQKANDEKRLRDMRYEVKARGLRDYFMNDVGFENSRRDHDRDRIEKSRLTGELGLYQQHSHDTKYDFQVNSKDNNDNTKDSSSDQLLDSIKRCRRCGNGIELKDGCLKMKCICGYRFCYNCGSENAQCSCTGKMHGFYDQMTKWGDFSGLHQEKSAT